MPHPRASALALAFLLAACGREPAPASQPPPAVVGQRLSVHPAPISDIRLITGQIETRDQSQARARIGGLLVQLSVRAGDQVRRGQVIGRVTDQRLGFEAAAARAQAAAAQAQASQAQTELQRAQYLFAAGAFSRSQLDQVQTQARSAQSALAAAQALALAGADLVGQGEIVAPADGQVLVADTPAGSAVVAGQAVATITAGPPVLRLQIPEQEARGLKVGDRLELAAEDLPGQSSGQVAQIYPALIAGQVTADLSVPGLRADRTGARVRVRLPLGQRMAILVPRDFVAHRYGLDFVRLVQTTGQVSDIAVQIAPAPAGDNVEVLSGLHDGDVLVKPAP